MTHASVTDTVDYKFKIYIKNLVIRCAENRIPTHQNIVFRPVPVWLSLSRTIKIPRPRLLMEEITTKIDLPPLHRERGRPNPSVSKALHLFGVTDLREVLDKKHQEQEQTRSGPPPDPSYNYLKDPLRENTHGQQTHKQYKGPHSDKAGGGDTYPKSRIFRGSRGQGRGTGFSRGNHHYASKKSTFEQNLVNIKVEVATSTGERSCVLDEETKLADIKPTPNYKLKEPRSPGNVRNYTDKPGNEWGRGRGHRGGDRGRSRGGRGRGMRGERPPRQDLPVVASEENWDNECVDNPVPSAVEYEKETKEGQEEHEIEDQEQFYDEHEEEEEYLETVERTDALEEASNDDITKILEEKLVITPSENEEKHKRTVKFQLEDKQEVSQGLEGERNDTTEHKKEQEKSETASNDQ
ncbi:hypothetical protein NQ315_015176 [Exocentrus adspersus]|uniref:Hyaluronan/mRNA-binding protein domain-containing protein n=1 Tax=Exocentrus adspersus TaxID=1586481 RepID=A0AAV8VIJ1_9CUCU|nr:hypothetical protein NQ315_015176 [Exocentrus adspersus]